MIAACGIGAIGVQLFATGSNRLKTASVVPELKE
jgi:hypothetical protein